MKTILNQYDATKGNKIFVHQMDARGCWFASSLMAKNFLQSSQLTYDGEKKKFMGTQLYLEVKQNGIDLFAQGGDAAVMLECMQQINPTYKRSYGYNAAAIAASLSQGAPVVLGYKKKSYDHYALVVSIDDATNELWILDPENSSFAETKISASGFTNATEFYYV